MKDNGLLAVLEQMVVCRRCGTPTTRHETGEEWCGPCWRHMSLREERRAQAAAHDGRVRARKGVR